MANFNREKMRILLVEDHKEAWEIAAFYLEEYMLIFACDFDEGLRLARRGYFDLYILDNWLPDGNGVELCRAIREFDPNTPILFYSAAAYAEDIKEGLLAGAQAYLTKPVSHDELRQAVAQMISAGREKNFEAWRAEIAAIREELAVQYAESAQRVNSAGERRPRAVEKLLRLNAEKAFYSAGGARGEFARRWPSVFAEEVRHRRMYDTASGH